MTILANHTIEQLIHTEAGVHYGEPPPYGIPPFVYLDRNSPILLSAPHGCRTFRDRENEKWHEEDEYTAGMALLLSELCDTSVIATIWRTDDSDPNDTKEDEKCGSPYKQALRVLKAQGKIRWVIDLHGASVNSSRMAETQLVDLGTGKESLSLPVDNLNALRQYIEKYIGPGATDRRDQEGWTASTKGRSITAFSHQTLGLHSVQVEIKPCVRIAQRRTDASMYGKALADGGGPYSAPAHMVVAMMQALVDFIEYLKASKE